MIYMGRKRLGESLIEAGLISKEQLALALNEQIKSRQKLGQVLIRLGFITVDTLITFLAKQHEVLGVNLYKEVIDEGVQNLIPRHVMEKFYVLPIGFKVEMGIKRLIVAMSDPANLELIDNLRFITGYTIEPVYAREEDLRWFTQYYGYYKKKELS